MGVGPNHYGLSYRCIFTMYAVKEMNEAIGVFRLIFTGKLTVSLRTTECLNRKSADIN